MKYEQLTSAYLSDLFPEFEIQIKDKMKVLGEELPHSIYSDVLNPFLRNFFNSPCTDKEYLVRRIFEFYEEIAQHGDMESKNLLEVSLLEALYDTKKTYEGALKYMMNETKCIFENISSYLRIPN